MAEYDRRSPRNSKVNEVKQRLPYLKDATSGQNNSSVSKRQMSSRNQDIEDVSPFMSSPHTRMD